jgi:hypothetical protein
MDEGAHADAAHRGRRARGEDRGRRARFAPPCPPSLEARATATTSPQKLEDKTGGAWRPSPGSVYPTLQLLEDEGLVRSTERDGKRVFEITDAGRAEATERIEQDGGPPGGPAEVRGPIATRGSVRATVPGLQADRRGWLARTGRAGPRHHHGRAQAAVPDPRIGG